MKAQSACRDLHLSGDSEVMIAQEQAVICKKGLLKSVQGTLILTSTRLIFVCGAEDIESFTSQVEKKEPVSKKISDESRNFALDLEDQGGILVFSEVDSLESIPASPLNLFIPISDIKSVSGHHGIAGMPNLKVEWSESDKDRQNEFEQTLTGGRRKPISDWKELIQKLRDGTLKLRTNIPSPPEETLEGKVAIVMGDLQEKGLIEIEEQVERMYKIDLDPDEIQQACEKLVSQGFLAEQKDSSGDTFYWKISPII
jgi:hypothetical protein